MLTWLTLALTRLGLRRVAATLYSIIQQLLQCNGSVAICKKGKDEYMTCIKLFFFLLC